MKNDRLQVVILCGGKGTRLKEHSELVPKPLIEVGGWPILWHVMKIYSFYGFNEFILCLGHQGRRIKEFFVEYERGTRSDFQLSLGRGRTRPLSVRADWEIVFAETGEETNTGGRVKRIEKYIRGDMFLLTYADGLANIDIADLLRFHREGRRIGTVTVVNPRANFGVAGVRPDGSVVAFREKPRLDIWINGGFFVFHRRFFDYLTDNCVLEGEPLERLVKDEQLLAYRHGGFWACMDTYKDTQELCALWDAGRADWKAWSD